MAELVQTGDGRTNYWKLRALSELQARQIAEGRLALVSKQLEAHQTQARIAVLMREMGMEQGNWQPDDEQERFVRTDGRGAPQ